MKKNEFVQAFHQAPSEFRSLHLYIQSIHKTAQIAPQIPHSNCVKERDSRAMAAAKGAKQAEMEDYEDLLPAMAGNLEAEDFVAELCGGFRLLADGDRRAITAESLKRNAALLGMGGMTAEEADAMVREGDLDGDGALNEAEFCILMVRLSPEMMEDAEAWLEKAIARELLLRDRDAAAA